MPEILKDQSGNKIQDWIPVQPGLFDFPLKEGQLPALLANRCKNCGQSFFPKRTLCPVCFDNGAMEDITLDGRGTIYSATVVHFPSPSGIKAPYAYGYVDIPTNKIRVFALFTGDDPASFRSGRQVELILEPIGINPEGKQIIGFKFRPVTS